MSSSPALRNRDQHPVQGEGEARVTDPVWDDLQIRNAAVALQLGGGFDAEWRLGRLIGELIVRREQR